MNQADGIIEVRTWRGRIALQALITVISALFALPLYWTLKYSLMGSGLGNYLVVVQNPSLPYFFLSSVIIAVGAIVVTFVCTSLCAYALAKLQLRWREGFFYILLIALTMPTAVLTVPLFVTIQGLHLFDTYWAVILPISALTIPFNVLLARSYVARLPDELLEAARIDGCSSFSIFMRIVLPLIRPIAVVTVIWTLITAWNEYLLPLIFLQSPTKQPLTLLPQFFEGQYGSDQGKIVAAAVIALLPEIIAYVFAQRWFEAGLTAGALK
jgi:ABC-type glycerol-3-phosphate transport system permease component